MTHRDPFPRQRPFALVELDASFADDQDCGPMAALTFAERDMKPTGMITQRFRDGRLCMFGFVPYHEVPVAGSRPHVGTQVRAAR